MRHNLSPRYLDSTDRIKAHTLHNHRLKETHKELPDVKWIYNCKNGLFYFLTCNDSD